jgi:arabinofuranosyltransferase
MNTQILKKRIVPGLCLIIIIGIFFFHSYTLFPYTDDDTFISFRYADNFASGYGLVFNKGERVEGYTNFLWTLIISLIIKTGHNPLLPTKLLGILISIGTILLTFSFSNLLNPEEDNKGKNLIAPLLLSVSSSFTAWSCWGLETALFSLLILLSYYLLTKEFIIESNKSIYCSITFFLASITRPEGLVMFFLGFFYVILYRIIKYKNIGNIRRLIFLLLTFIIPYSCYFLWRWNYYGYLFPNTYYVRMGLSFETLIPQFKRGLFYFIDYILNYGGWGLFFAFFLMRRKDKNVLDFFVFLLLFSFIYSIYVGGDSKQFIRLLVPYMPFYYLLVQEGIYDCKKYWLDKLLPNANCFSLVITCFLVFSIAIFTYMQTLSLFGLFNEKNHSFSELLLGKTESFQQVLWFPNNQRSIGLYLRDHVSETSSIAVIVAGSIPYYSRLATIDMLGVNDPHIAHLDVVTNKELNKQLGTIIPDSKIDIKLNKKMLRSAHQKIDLEYVLSKNPTIVFVGDPVVLTKYGYKKFQKTTNEFTITYWAKEDPFF